MKLLSLSLGLFASFLPMKAEKPALDVLKLVEAIKRVENSPIDYVSPVGARGVFQLKSSTWNQYSKHPHEWANRHDEASKRETLRVATEHAKWILHSAIPTLRIPATPYSFALVWGPGYGNVEKLNLTDKNVDFAKRCENIYETLKP